MRKSMKAAFGILISIVALAALPALSAAQDQTAIPGQPDPAKR